MQILSWNIAGLRAQLKKESFHYFLSANNFSIVCLQETKAEESQVILTDEIMKKYPFRFWNSSKGTTQKKGFSGTTIWSVVEPVKTIVPEFDEEGRIIALIYEKFVLINVYVPNSQKLDCSRYHFREEWNKNFSEFIKELHEYWKREIIICGDFNVAHLDIDISNPKSKKNKVPGFFDNERIDFAYLLKLNDLNDIFRTLNPETQKSTYWSNFLKADRTQKNGWGIDYFLCTDEMLKLVTDCKIVMEQMGSDHCPLILEFNISQDLELNKNLENDLESKLKIDKK